MKKNKKRGPDRKIFEEEMERLTGHMIWIPGSWPHKLIPSLEWELARFMASVEGVRR